MAAEETDWAHSCRSCGADFRLELKHCCITDCNWFKDNDFSSRFSLPCECAEHRKFGFEDIGTCFNPKYQSHVCNGRMSNATLPEMLDFDLDENGRKSVVTRLPLPSRSLFGPFIAPLYPATGKNVARSVFAILQSDPDGTEACKLLLATESDDDCNWMKHVRFTIDRSAANLVAFQSHGGLYFVTVKPAAIGEELIVAYNESYLQSFVDFEMRKLKPITPKPTAAPSTVTDVQSPVDMEDDLGLAPDSPQCSINRQECRSTGQASESSTGSSVLLLFSKGQPDALFSSGSGSYPQSSVDFQMAKLRPIAPKPTGGPSTVSCCAFPIESSVGVAPDSPQCSTRRRQRRSTGQASTSSFATSLLLKFTNGRSPDAPSNSPDVHSFPPLPFGILPPLPEFPLPHVDVEAASSIDIDIIEASFPPLLPVPAAGDLPVERTEDSFRKFVRKYTISQRSRVAGPDGFSCRFCPELFPTPKHVAEHEDQVHKPPLGHRLRVRRVPRKKYPCKYCGLPVTRAEMIEHYPTHVVNGQYPCTKNCGSFFELRVDLEEHLKSVHEPRYKCDICGYRTDRKRRLKDHRQTHDVPAFHCTECGESLTTEKGLEAHMERLHSGKRSKRLRAVRQGPLRRLVKRDQWETNLFKCIPCKIGFPLKKAHVRHLENKHPEVPKSSIPELNLPMKTILTFTCRVCGRLHYSKDEAESHVGFHDVEEIIKAQERKVLNLKDSVLLLGGAVLQKDRELYHCQVCEKSFDGPRHFLQHCKSHHPEYHNLLMPHMPADINYVVAKHGPKKRIPSEEDE